MAVDISVVMPAYNSASTIEESMRSALHCSSYSIELIVVDDGSTDDTLEVVSRIKQQDTRVKLLKQEHKRQAEARNLGIKAALGKYIAYLDSDDIMIDGRFEKQFEYLRIHGGVDVVGGARINIKPNGEIIPGIKVPRTSDIELKKYIFKECPFTTSTVFIRAEVAKRNLFDPDMTPCEDHDLWLRMRERYVFSNIGDPLVYYRIKDRIPLSHTLKIAQMYYRHIRSEKRPPYYIWYCVRPLLSRFKPRS